MSWARVLSSPARMTVRIRLARFGRKVSACGSGMGWEARAMGGNAAPDRTAADPPLPLQNLPVFRIVVADARAPRDGKHLEVVGHYDPVPGKRREERGGEAKPNRSAPSQHPPPPPLPPPLRQRRP